MNLDSVPGLDLASGTFTVPLWAVGVVAALLVALIVIAVVRSGLNELGSLVFRAAVIVIAVVFGWTYINRSGERDRADERRALDSRSAELVSRATAPGSAIACLEATNTETVEDACERIVFAGPETVAAATAYIGARLTLLAEAHEYTARRDQAYESSIAGLRRTIGADRYGLVSQVLATRDGCTADACDAFGLVYDDKKLRANLKDRLFDQIVARYSVNWPTRTRPLASSTSTGGPAPGPNAAFPSSQSIPPASIMNNEAPAAQAPAGNPPAQAAAPAPEPRPTNTAPTSAARRPPAKKSDSGPLSLNPAAKQ
ncbi:MAG: hypothetical protein WDO17_13455 [Alphaproteobacteria bacterium]